MVFQIQRIGCVCVCVCKTPFHKSSHNYHSIKVWSMVTNSDMSCLHLVYLPRISSTLTSNAGCIDLDRKLKTDRLVLTPCERFGVVTERSGQSTAGVCTSLAVNAYFDSAALLDIKSLVPGRYYFDCHHIDGNIRSSEVIICECN